MNCLYLAYYHLVFITAVAMVTGFGNSSPALRPFVCTVSGWWMMLFIDAECVTCRDVLTVLLVTSAEKTGHRRQTLEIITVDTTAKKPGGILSLTTQTWTADFILKQMTDLTSSLY